MTSLRLGRWAECSKFMTGFSAVGAIAIPSILLHAHLIVVGAFLLQLLSVAIIFGTVFAFDHALSEDVGGW